MQGDWSAWQNIGLDLNAPPKEEVALNLWVAEPEDMEAIFNLVNPMVLDEFIQQGDFMGNNDPPPQVIDEVIPDQDAADEVIPVLDADDGILEAAIDLNQPIDGANEDAVDQQVPADILMQE